MSKAIPQLKSMWSHEKELYKTQEVGSGVQRFVKDTLECTDIFDLREGKLSTPKENRKNEFIHEKKTQDRRQADFVVYISSDIIIPVEVEQYTNIERGEDQLFQYQSDLEKKYGILTDGYAWRFYNNNLYREFNLEQIFAEIDYFLEFWMEYIKPENYYLSFFEEAGQLPLFGKEELEVECSRQLFFQDITTLIRSFKRKLRVEGYFNGLDKGEAEKKATEISYAYIIQFILYKTLVDNKFEDFENDYKNRIKTIHNAIKNASYKEILGSIDGMSEIISRNIYRPFAKEQEYIRGKLLRLLRSAKNRLSDVSPWLDIVVFVKKFSFRNVRNDIFGFVYENYLKELYEEEEKRGQYFTDPSVVNFMLAQIDYTAREISDKIEAGTLDKLSIVDPACGSGTFLYKATDEIIKSFDVMTEEASKEVEEIVTHNVFGLDIEEFPLYLAEMGILMRMLPLIMGDKYNNPLEKKIKVFLTKDSIAEFIGSGLETTDTDAHARGGQLSYFGRLIQPVYPSYVRDEVDLAEMKGSMTSFPRRRFDYVIANPPYVSYNDCSKRGVLVFDLIKKGKVALNDIFGVNLHSTPDSRKKYPPKPNFFSFFIALGLALLKDDGRLCYIVPQTMLTAGDLDVLRYHLSKRVTIERIIVFNSNLFIERGLRQARTIPTSSLILVIDKNPPSTRHDVDVITYEGEQDTIEITMDNILRGKKVSIKRIKQRKLLENTANWNFIKQDKALLDFLEEYDRRTNHMSTYYDHASAERQFKSRFYFDIGFSLDHKEITKHGNRRDFYELLDFKTFYGYSHFMPTSYYPRDANKIELTKNSQGYVTLEQQYKIVWSIKNPDRFCFTDHPIIFYMGKASIICGRNKDEILYLLSLLNSPITELVLEANLKSEQEKEYLVPIKAVKEFVRVPKLTVSNKWIKDELIGVVDEMLALEKKTLSSFVDFSGVLMQKFHDVRVAGSKLLLIQDKREITRAIEGDSELVAKAIADNFGERGLKLEAHPISLRDLRSLAVVDSEKQAKLKDYINDLVFALYFKIPLKAVGLDKAAKIQKACSKSKYYQLF